MAGEGRLDLAETHDRLGRQQVLLPRAIERHAILPQRAAGDDAGGAFGERDLHLAEGLVINA